MANQQNEIIVCTNCDSTNTEFDEHKWINENDCLEVWECLDCGQILSVIRGEVLPERTWKSWWEQD